MREFRTGCNLLLLALPLAAAESCNYTLDVSSDGSDYHNGGGHAWVIDGEWNGYFHCNWGWAGAADGFYAKHNYFPISSRAYYEQNVDPGTIASSLSSKDYDWNFRMITYSY